MAGIQEEYKIYLQQAESLPKEMKRRGIQFVDLRFFGEVDESPFRVYVDATAEVPIRDQPLLAKSSLSQIVTKRIGLNSVGELIYHLTPRDLKYQKEIPRNLDMIAHADLKALGTALRIGEGDCTPGFGLRQPIEGL